MGRAAHRQTPELALVGAEREVRGDGHLLILRKELELDMFTGTQ
jgi:hypothetical protein